MLTHILPGLYIYFWVWILMVICYFCLVNVFLIGLRYIFPDIFKALGDSWKVFKNKKETERGSDILPNFIPKDLYSKCSIIDIIYIYMIEFSYRILITIFLQACYLYMVLFYAEKNISGVEYISIIVNEFALRSQYVCFFEENFSYHWLMFI